MIIRESKPPRDYEVMDSVLARGDAVDLASELSVSPQLIRAWCRPPETDEEFKSTGKFGPLARLRTLIFMIKNDDGAPDRAYPIGEYIAALLGGVFVPISPPAKSPESDMLSRISSVLKETGEAIETVRVTTIEKEKNSPAEKARCGKEIDEAIVALVQMKGWLDKTTR